MAAKAKKSKYKKEKTKYPCIYHNLKTGKYDVKYNYTVYNPVTAKNEYKQKGIYNIPTLAEARATLDRLRTDKKKQDDKNVTLSGVLELWEKEALTQDYSPSTIRTTRSNMRMIYQFLSEDTKVKNITKQIYYDLIADLKQKYKPETVHTLNGTFRKMIALCVREELISENILIKSRNIRTVHKKEYRVIAHKDFVKIRDYFDTHDFSRKGIDHSPRYKFLYTLLYYTGMRIGEATALRYSDIEEFTYFRTADAADHSEQGDFSEPISFTGPSYGFLDGRMTGHRVKVTKTYLEGEHKVKDTTKNYKNRTVPLQEEAENLYLDLQQAHMSQPGSSMDDRIFTLTHATYNRILQKACRELELPSYHCHEFRHTFISNMIRENVPLTVIEKVSGDVIGTIIKRYAHMFESDEVKVLNALSKIQDE